METLAPGGSLAPAATRPVWSQAELHRDVARAHLGWVEDIFLSFASQTSWGEEQLDSSLSGLSASVKTKPPKEQKEVGVVRASQ